MLLISLEGRCSIFSMAADMDLSDSVCAPSATAGFVSSIIGLNYMKRKSQRVVDSDIPIQIYGGG